MEGRKENQSEICDVGITKIKGRISPRVKESNAWNFTPTPAILLMLTLGCNFTFNYTRIIINFWFYYSKFRIPRQVSGPEIAVHWFQVTLFGAYN